MYKKGYGELRLFGKEDTDKKLASVLATTARGLGASEDKIKQIMEMLDVGRMTLEQFQKEISEIISETQKSDKNKVMVIDEKDIENHLNHGWTFVGLTPSGRCIIKQSL
jgi:2-keto-3-deoxy-L-rhamnonate aldolase RhmA